MGNYLKKNNLGKEDVEQQRIAQSKNHSKLLNEVKIDLLIVLIFL